MQELVSYIVESLTGNSDFEVAISEEERLITITLSSEDIGRVIGRGGKTAKAIRLIVKAAAAKRIKRYDVEIREINEDSDR